jgi:predicted methyltransferase
MIRTAAALTASLAATLLLSACAGAYVAGDVAPPDRDRDRMVGAASSLRGAPGPALAAVLAAPHRTPEQRARDAHRRPADTLAFWGLRPGATVIEIGPGEGWWTEILAPYAARTGGRYIAALGTSAGADAFEARYRANPALYGQFGRTAFGAQSGPLAPAGSVDMILVARSFHNWAGQEGFTDKAMRDFAAALKPGGVLAVEQHRAPEGADPRAGTGYVPESYVIEAARRAGLVLDARSELNANPRDTRDHPFGVWTLPPVRRATQAGRTLTAEERARYDALGESDRMTLRFRKPA